MWISEKRVPNEEGERRIGKMKTIAMAEMCTHSKWVEHCDFG